MPAIKDFGGFKITMYFEDHNPPHFHIVSPAQAAVVEIATLTVIAGTIRAAQLREALEWAEANKELLEQKWTELH
jgi:hypothetical protein